MEENKTQNPNSPESPILNQGPFHSIKQHHPKKFKAIIILAIILLVILVTLYFLNKKQKTIDPPYTQQQAVELLESVSKATDEQGVPPAKKQIDIMKYNSQE